jgi:GrpB-like predicted nucleotidyltransferase (UPF0157 family)
MGILNDRGRRAGHSSSRLRVRQPELVRHRIFRNWLRCYPGDRDRYAAAKRHAASEANAGGERVMQYNASKQQVIREIYHRAFVAAGLLEA